MLPRAEADEFLRSIRRERRIDGAGNAGDERNLRDIEHALRLQVLRSNEKPCRTLTKSAGFLGSFTGHRHTSSWR